MSDYRVGDRVVGTAVTALGIDNGLVGTVVEVFDHSGAIWVQFDDDPQMRWVLYGHEVSAAYPAPALTIASIQDVYDSWSRSGYYDANDAMIDIGSLLREYNANREEK